MKRKARGYRKLMAVFVILFILNFGFGVLTSCQQFGANPSGDYLNIIKASPNYDVGKGQFVNLITMSNIGDDVNFWDDPFGRVTPNYLFNSNKTSPNTLMPEAQNANMLEFSNSKLDIKFIWLGHSTILLSING